MELVVPHNMEERTQNKGRDNLDEAGGLTSREMENVVSYESTGRGKPLNEAKISYSDPPDGKALTRRRNCCQESLKTIINDHPDR